MKPIYHNDDEGGETVFLTGVAEGTVPCLEGFVVVGETPHQICFRWVAERKYDLIYVELENPRTGKQVYYGGYQTKDYGRAVIEVVREYLAQAADATTAAAATTT